MRASVDSFPADRGATPAVRWSRRPPPCGLCPATDQRNFSRQGVCDIGACEFGGVLLSGRVIDEALRWWPLVLILIGIVVVGQAYLRPRR